MGEPSMPAARITEIDAEFFRSACCGNDAASSSGRYRGSVRGRA